MTLSSYPLEIRSIIGHNIEISVMMVAPPWSSRYDNLGRVRAVLNGIEVGNSGERSLPGGSSIPLNIIFNIPGNAIPVGTHTIILVTELRVEYVWYNAGDYNVTAIIDPRPCNPIWICEQPLNGYEKDGCGNRRLNNACNPGTVIPGSSNTIIINAVIIIIIIILYVSFLKKG